MKPKAEFIDKYEFPVHGDDEDKTKVSDLMQDEKTGLIKLRMIHSSKPTNQTRVSVELSTRESKALSATNKPEYLSAPNKSNVEQLNTLQLPDGKDLHSTDTSPVMPRELDPNEWKAIFESCNLFSGIRLTEKEPGYSFERIFKFRENAKLSDRVRTYDFSDLKSYLSDRRIENSFVSSKLYDGGVNISSPLIGFGIHGEYSKRKAETTETRTVYSTCCQTYPRAIIPLDLSYLEPTPEFLSEMATVAELNPSSPQSIEMLKEVLSKYGHVYAQEVVLGGQLYQIQEHSIKSIVEEQDIRKAAELKFKADLSKIFSGTEVSVGGGFRHENMERKESEQRTTFSSIQAWGGDTLLTCNGTVWCKTVAKPKLWRVIEYRNYQSVITLLTLEQQNKIVVIIEAAKERGMNFMSKNHRAFRELQQSQGLRSKMFAIPKPIQIISKNYFKENSR